MGGYDQSQIAEIIKTVGDLSKLNPQQIQDLVKRKSMETLGLNGNTQKIVRSDEIESHILEGWEYVKDLPNHKAIARLPK